MCIHPQVSTLHLVDDSWLVHHIPSVLVDVYWDGSYVQWMRARIIIILAIPGGSPLMRSSVVVHALSIGGQVCRPN